MLPILTKAVSAALVVVVAATLAEAFGPFWGGLIASLPVSAGPAYLFLAMEHDSAFVAASALSSFATNAAIALFLTVHAIAAERRSVWPCLGRALAAWLIASLGIRQFDWTPASALALNVIAYAAGFAILARRPKSTALPLTVARRSGFELAMRATAVAIFVSAVVLGGRALGPRATGIAAVFPISLTSLLAIVQPRIGGAAAALLSATALRAMAGFGLALLALHETAPIWGTGAALLLSLSVTMAWSLGLLCLKARAPD